MLRITKANEAIEVKTIPLCFFGAPGIGKTSLACTASKPLLLDADMGAHRSRNRGDTVRISTWADVSSLSANDLAPYDTVITDTAGRVLDLMTADIIATGGDPKARGGSLTIQGYGVLKGRFLAWVKLLRSFGKDVIFVCHSTEEHKGDDLIERLDATGSSKGEIYKSADLMGKLYLGDGRRMLDFSPTGSSFGKNPTQLPILTVPDFGVEPQWLAGIIAQAKVDLSKVSAESIQVAEKLTSIGDLISNAVTLTDFDGMLTLCKDAPESVRTNAKRLLLKAAKVKGYEFNKTTGAFDLAATP